ncbi:MAG: helix-hairpin-helix domain-containing protein [Candidatus Azobacteroides sp.]|nr:helix-hairpin-helix domain-containing protein [Candidatus Azobacteroides sp.]
MEYIEEFSDSEEGSAYIETLFDELSYLSENPFNLNTVTKSDLERLPFLSEIQIENLLYYVYKYAPVQSIYELKNVEGLDMQTINYLLSFVYVGEVKSNENINPKHVLKYGKHEMYLRTDYCFQEKAGYHTPTEEELQKNPNKYYLGENYYLSTKYGFSYKDKIQLGIVGEKDAGEPFWNNYHKGFDYYSVHFALKNIGMLKALYLGDYNASFGQGLVLNTDFVMGKSSSVININKKNAGFKRHFSTNEVDYLRGAALSLEKGNCMLNLLYSHKRANATVTDTEIISFKTDGYNRTYKDLEKKNQAELNLTGADFQWKTADFNIGATAVYYDFGGKTLSPTPQSYNLFYLRRKNNYNAGINYSFQRRILFFQGEIAISRNGARATINTLQFNPASFIAFVASYRNYQKNYQSQYGRTFAEGSSVQNESGFYFGSNVKLKKRWEIATYIDAFKFPWLKYGINAPSEGSDFLIQVNYRLKHSWDMNLRYKDKIKEKNYTPDKAVMTSILPYEQKKIRYQLNYNNSTGLKARLQLDYTFFTGTDKQENKGWMISQSTGYTDMKYPIQIDFGTSYFKTDNWDTRMYAYEKNILYAFSFPTFYGEGIRNYSVLKISILKNITFYAKIAWTHYFDRNEIGSDLEKINGNNKTDANLLLKVKF